MNYTTTGQKNSVATSYRGEPAREEEATINREIISSPFPRSADLDDGHPPARERLAGAGRRRLRPSLRRTGCHRRFHPESFVLGGCTANRRWSCRNAINS